MVYPSTAVFIIVDPVDSMEHKLSFRKVLRGAPISYLDRYACILYGGVNVCDGRCRLLLTKRRFEFVLACF
jgi:hypothetical protein